MDYCSAQQIFYASNSPYYLQVHQQGEVDVAIALSNFSSSKDTNLGGYQFQVQTAYSPYENIVVAGSYSKYTERTYDGWRINGVTGDLGIGAYWFNQYGKHGFLLDTYLTIARGYMMTSYGYGKSDRFSHNKFGLQLGMHYLIEFDKASNKTLRVGWISRPALLVYTDLVLVEGYVPRSVFSSSWHRYNNTDEFLSYLTSNNDIPFIENTFMVQFSKGNIRYFMNYNYTNIVLSNQLFNKYANDKSIQIGLIIDLHS